MMDATAIQQIQNETAKHDALIQFDNAVGRRPAVLIPDGFRVRQPGDH